MEVESGVTGRITDEPLSSDIQRDHMEDASCVTRSVIDERHCWDIQRDQMEGERMVLLEVSSMNLIPIHGMSKEIKWKMKVVLLELSLMKFILWI